MSLWRRSRALRVVASILAVLAALWLGAWAYTESALRAELQRIRDAGEPVSMADLVPPPVPDDQNAALVYARYYAADSPGWSRLAFATEDEARVIADFAFRDQSHGQAREILRRPAVAEGLREIRRASHLRCAAVTHWASGGQYPPALMAAVRMGTWLGAEAVLAAGDGDGTEALECIAAIFRIARQIDCDPRATLLALQTERSACSVGWRVLGATDLPAKRSMALIREIATPDARQRTRRQMLTMRAQVLDVFRGDVLDHYSSLALPMGDLAEEDRVLLHGYRSFVCRPIRTADELSCLGYFRRSLRRIAEPSRALRVPPPSYYHGVRGDFWAEFARQVWFFPAGKAVLGSDLARLYLEVAGRRAASVNLFRTGLALVAHKQEHGAYPETLADLRLPPGCDPTDDPFSGGPLKYAPEGDGFVLYSVGADGDDDGGRDEDGWEGDIVESLAH